MLEFILMHPLK